MELRVQTDEDEVVGVVDVIYVTDERPFRARGLSADWPADGGSRPRLRTKWAASA